MTDTQPVDLAGRVAVITGGSGGIGLGIAATLDRRGARVVIAARDADAVARATAQLTHGAGFPGCDVRDPSRVEALFAFAEERFGPVDIAVACAGVRRGTPGSRLVPPPVSALGDADWDEEIDISLRGVFHLARAAARRMTARGSGQIVNISSARGGLRGEPYGAGYCAAKMAARALFHALSAEVTPAGVRAFSVLPDAVATSLIAGTGLGRTGMLTPDQLGDVVADLLAMPLDAVLEDVRVSLREGRPAAQRVAARSGGPA
ncbi:MAG TPA: SDR family oxidoreductase [Candidatus Polarisedimenticolia bacterium]|jgi:NAD(P)-dependent dehydrogenase (short-subunit alcohol dehydrogenase family)|nr:SDR family oxidoreductase [Candidatus Polarisedimenticolia bacterium]